MTDKANPPELKALAERCEQATGPDRELESEIFAALNPTMLPAKNIPNIFVDSERYVETVYITKHTKSVPRFTASLDAALTLVPEGWDWNVGISSVPDFPPAEATCYPQHQPFPVELDICTQAASPALALCAAALRARAAGEVK